MAQKILRKVSDLGVEISLPKILKVLKEFQAITGKPLAGDDAETLC